jgi:hypothetical protein
VEGSLEVTLVVTFFVFVAKVHVRLSLKVGRLYLISFEKQTPA